MRYYRTIYSVPLMISINSEIFCFQTDTIWEDAEANFELLRKVIDSARPPAGSLLVFPEMATVGFSMDTGKIAEKQDGPSMEFFSGVARERSCFVVAGIPLREASGVVNAAVSFGADGTEIARYHKMRPFPLVQENDYYEAGSETTVFEYGEWKIAPFVCYDLRFPELFRKAVKKGAEAFVVIANWPSKRVGHWKALLRARAIENQAYAIGVNRCGDDPNFSFPGASIVFDPMGEVVASAGDGVEAISATLDRSLLETWRKEFPALTDAQ